MGPCVVSIFQFVSNKMQRYTVYLYLETALHVSGGTSTHHQERKQLYLQHLVTATCRYRGRLGTGLNVIPIYSYIQQDAMLHSLFISVNCSTCFGWYFHPSSGAHATHVQHLVFVTPLLLSAAIVEELEPV